MNAILVPCAGKLCRSPIAAAMPGRALPDGHVLPAGLEARPRRARVGQTLQLIEAGAVQWIDRLTRITSNPLTKGVA